MIVSVLLLSLAAAPPESPPAALEALARYGPVPECRPRESIERGGQGDLDHQHHFSPVEPIAALAGKGHELAPYLEHWSEAVVARAARLLCFCADPVARAAIERLIRRYPCRGWIARLAVATGHPILSCDTGARENTPYGFQVLDDQRPVVTTDRARALAQRISKGEAGAVHEALWASVAMDAARRGEALGALQQVDTVAGVALLLRSHLESWEAELLSRHPMEPIFFWEWDRKNFARDALNPALETAAARQKTSREDILIRAVASLQLESFEPVGQLIGNPSELMYAAGRYGRSPAGQVLQAPKERAFIEFLNRYTQGRDPTEIAAESRRITALKQAGKRKELAAIAFAGLSPGFHQLLAAVYLLGLGADEPRAFALLELTPHLALYDLNAIRAEVQALAAAAPAGPRKARLDALFAKYDAHCKMNDCTPQSPR